MNQNNYKLIDVEDETEKSLQIIIQSDYYSNEFMLAIENNCAMKAFSRCKLQK